MVPIPNAILDPRFVRLDASTICQLKCPSCPTASGATGKKLGVGYLTLENFKKFVRQNPNVSHIEISNWGEVFLNKYLAKIFAYAYRHNVCLYIANGANLNNIREEVFEALVKYKLRRITCSIDGASQETYVQYRIKGNFDQVIDNIKKINRWKAKYRSNYPQLKWQFVAFGHNEHEIIKAKEMAKALDMGFYLKLSWGDLYDLPNFSPVRNKELVGRETGLGVSSRKEYFAKYGQDYVEHTCCWDLWTAPQINYDGRMLGCPINYWGDYGNVLDKNLDAVVNGEKMKHAREMLMGKREAQEGIPCTTCKIYHQIKKDQAWVTDEDVELVYRPGRRRIMLEKVLGEKGTDSLAAFISGFERILLKIKNTFKHGRFGIQHLAEIFSSEDPRLLPNQGYPLPIPFSLDEKELWKPYFIFRGPTKDIKDFSCHASALAPGHCPHPPHTHKEEEILIMLAGEAALELPLLGADGEGRTRLQPGEFVYYPAGYPHTLQTTSATSANYMMLKWYTPNQKENLESLPFGKFRIYDALRDQSQQGFSTKTIFEGPSKWLTRLQCHSSILSPGSGYKPHIDPYNVLILLLEGEVETFGKRFASQSVIFYPSGKRHGMFNPGKIPAKYVVFEFQS